MPEMNNISQREIYDRLIALEAKVDALAASSKDVVTAFDAAKGAFAVLEMAGRFVKPILWIGGIIAATVVFFHNLKNK